MTFTNSAEIEKTRLEIITYIKDYIAKNNLNSGDKIPSENALAAQFHANRNTVRSALMGLRIQGILYSHKGKGFFVAERPDKLTIEQNIELGLSEIFDKSNWNYSNKLLAITKRTPNQKEQKLLELSSAENVFELEQLRYISGKVFALCYSIIPEKWCPDLDVKMKGNFENFKGTNDIFHNIYGFEHLRCIKMFVQTFPPDEKDIKLLNVLDNIPILQQENVYEISSGSPIEYFIIRGRGDTFKIGFNFKN